jgi:ketosteroid isomerase-like protein
MVTAGVGRKAARASHARPQLASALAAVAIAVAVLLAGCASTAAKGTASSTAADEAAIADFNRRYVGAINDGDIATLSSLTTDGHIMLAPSRPPIVGKAANDEANGRAFQMFKFDEHWSPIETVISGDLAYQRGTFTVAATPKAGGETRNLSGNFLRIYRRQPDGSWRMVRDMFNSDKPTPSPLSN